MIQTFCVGVHDTHTCIYVYMYLYINTHTKRATEGTSAGQRGRTYAKVSAVILSVVKL